ncbi:MAG: hypothetical protein FWC42_07540 [Proteobacteria bacterium]|nr:hypothetical protein [Pseudomonadota bacterium]
MSLAANAGVGDYDINGAPLLTGNLQDDIDALGDGQHTITLHSDVFIVEGLEIGGKNIVFDLNTHKLEISNHAGVGLHVHGGSKVGYTGVGSFTVSSTGGNALKVEGRGSFCTLTGVQVDAGNYAAILSAAQAIVVVNGDVEALGAGDIGLIAGSGSGITVNGNTIVADGDGIGAFKNTEVIINGDLWVSGDSDNEGIYSDLGANVTVRGNVNMTGAARGIGAWEKSTVFVAGDITTSNGAAVYADEAAMVTVNGMVNATFTSASSGDAAGIVARDGAAIFVKRDVVMTSAAPGYAGVEVRAGGVVTIDGTLTAPTTCINIDGMVKTVADVVPSDKVGYSNMYSDGASSVWVTRFSVPATLIAPATPVASAAAPVAVPALNPALLAALAAALGWMASAGFRRKRRS